MRILIIGRSSKCNAEAFFSRAFQKLGHEVFLLDQYIGVRGGNYLRALVSRSRLLRNFLDVLPVNRKYLNKVLNEKSYDLIIVFKGELLSSKSLIMLSDHNPVLFWPDTLRFRPVLSEALEYYSDVIVTTERVDFFKGLGAKRVHSIYWACDPNLHRPIDVNKIFHVSFIGTFYPRRYFVLKGLRRRPHIFGDFWILKAGIHHPPVYCEDYVKTINMTVINLNIHHPVDIEADAPNMRVFEVACSKGFFLTEDMESLKKLFGRVITWRTVDDLNEKISYYLENHAERQEVAERMFEEASTKHTYYNRAETILNILH